MKLRNGRIVATNYDSRLYTRQDVRRGDPAFVMSRSALLEFAACPSKWIRSKWLDDSTDSTDWGCLIDCLLFEPQRFDERFAVKPKEYTNEDGDTKPWNANAKVCKAWLAEHAGRIIISQDDRESAAVAIARLKEDDFIAATLENSRFQVYAVAEYHDRKTGVIVPVKALIDILPNGNRRDVIDFKTARNASPWKWADVVNSSGYDAQAALFLDVLEAAGVEREQFRHIAQENEPPFEVARNELTVEYIKEGREKYGEALKLYASCLKSNHWPGYESNVMFDGWNLISPRAYHAAGPKQPDPGWLSEEKEAA